MVCPKCGSSNVNVQLVQTFARTKNKGCLFRIGRTLLIVCTLGLWLVFGKKSSSTKFKNEKLAVCNNCGHSWNV